MLNYEELKQLTKKYFAEASEEQIEILLRDLTRELEIMTHAKIRELVDLERRKKITG
ncbi:hypothetical protein [Pelosinus propionicus]|uniref:Uncharacterized protein n=1 Tax=Pelosinus propionicus DSM 13327 TaxID=1123291 RepID=A0A1I4HNI2_9FIRM|nr:hypothetical protein [Pelosinus propionicus]SFL43732.1 hypothetical protein SAMN04490355_1004134 [Pelosinus propionicus DSM 13327]